MKSSDNKNPNKDTGKYVRREEHAKIKAIVEGLMAADDATLDLSQPGSLDSLTMLVAEKLSAEHKWYKVIVEAKNPIYLPLYKSLYDHLFRTVGDLL